MKGVKIFPNFEYRGTNFTHEFTQNDHTALMDTFDGSMNLSRPSYMPIGEYATFAPISSRMTVKGTL